MSIKSKFGSVEDLISTVQWTDITDVSQLDAIATESQSVPVVIFKYSTRCNLSIFMLKKFEKKFDFEAGEVRPYFLDLRAFRDISDEMATRYGIAHESPQIILIKQGRAVYYANHEHIKFENLKERVTKMM